MNNRIFIVAHAPLAQALKACAMHVYPECAAEVLALDVKADDTPEQSLLAAQQLWVDVPNGDVLVLTDVLGATPANVVQFLGALYTSPSIWIVQVISLVIKTFPL